MIVDLSPLTNALLPLALAAVSAAGTTVVAFAYKHWPVLRAIADQKAVDNALTRAGGIAYTELAKAGEGAHITVHNQAVAAGVSYLVSSVKPELERLGATSDHIARMVTGELGTLLAADQTIKVSQAAAAPPDHEAAMPAA